MISNNNNKTELLAPAGDLEKLYTAVTYGADAVYIGGKNLGLRANTKNFTESEMREGISFAHKNGVKAYVTANIYAHNDDFFSMPEYFKSLYEMGADALIVSDAGVFSVAREAVPDIDIHISTQANNTNYKSALFWHKLGAKRIVLARELSLQEISYIRLKLDEAGAHDMELEAFVHGAMCISYSGRCLLSNAMARRDANRGECAHPCRYSYSIVEETRPGEFYPIEQDSRGTYIMNSKDLCMVEHIPSLINSGIKSFKIEGRVKTPFYVGAVVKAYREAIDDFFSGTGDYEHRKNYYMELVKKVSHRDYTNGFFFSKPDETAQSYINGGYVRGYDFCGVVINYDENLKMAEIEQRNKFSVGDEIEFFQHSGNGFKQSIPEIFNLNGGIIQSANRPRQIVKIKTLQPVKPFDMIIKLCRNEPGGI